MPGDLVTIDNLGDSFDKTDPGPIEVDADNVTVSVAGVTATTLNAALLEIFTAATAP